jgi:hypothetical protein
MTVLLRRSDVILLDEAEHVTRDGEVAASGRVDPLARKFACNFSMHYMAVAGSPRYHICAELEGLFCWVFLARMIVSNKAFDSAGFTPNWLLDGFGASKITVPKKLPGIAAVKKWDHVERDGTRIREMSLRLPSCGGVDIALSKAQMSVVGDPTGLLAHISRSVMQSRPHPNATHWRVTMR